MSICFFCYCSMVCLVVLILLYEWTEWTPGPCILDGCPLAIWFTWISAGPFPCIHACIGSCIWSVAIFVHNSAHNPSISEFSESISQQAHQIHQNESNQIHYLSNLSKVMCARVSIVAWCLAWRCESVLLSITLGRPSSSAKSWWASWQQHELSLPSGCSASWLFVAGSSKGPLPVDNASHLQQEEEGSDSERRSRPRPGWQWRWCWCCEAPQTTWKDSASRRMAISEDGSPETEEVALSLRSWGAARLSWAERDFA